MMKYSCNGEAFAKELMELLKDYASFAYYRSCVETYPRQFLEDTLFYVLDVPEDLITVTRSQLFKVILGMTYIED